MQNMRNKKRLSTLVLAFLLVFVVGAAFAFAPGHLDIHGNINLQAEGYVVWYSTVGTVEDNASFPLLPTPPPSPPGGLVGITPLGTPIGSAQFAEIVDRALPGPNTTSQRIVWDIYFANVGSVPGLGGATFHRARLTAQARNQGNVPALINNAVVTWEQLDGTVIPTPDLVALGLTWTIDESLFSGAGNTLPPGDLSDNVIVTVDWTGFPGGNAPAGFGPGTTGPAPITWPNAFAIRMVVTFNYVPV